MPVCEWGEWSECSATCRGGDQSRDEICQVGGIEIVNTSERRVCNTKPCTGLLKFLTSP